MFELITKGLSNEIVNILDAQGLPIRKTLDMDTLPFPEDITLVGDQDLMVLASRYMENYNMMRTQVACAQIAELEAENDYDFTEAKALMSTSTGKSTEKAG